MRAMRNIGPNPLRHVSILLAGVLATVTPLHFARADAAGERASLARVIHELQALEPLLRAAQSQANPDARVCFRAIAATAVGIRRLFACLVDHRDERGAQRKKADFPSVDWRRRLHQRCTCPNIDRHRRRTAESGAEQIAVNLAPGGVVCGKREVERMR